MVQKWYCLVCDYCGDVINYWECSSVEVALDTEREVVKNSGKTFCDKECYKKYLTNHCRSQDETDK